MAISKTTPYRDLLLEDLADPREAAEYLCEAWQDSPEMFLKALRNVAQAHGMTRIAEEAGVKRESLYRALSAEGNPRFGTLIPVLAALRIKTQFAAEDEKTESAPSAATPVMTTAQAKTKRRRGIAARVRRVVDAAQMELPFMNPDLADYKARIPRSIPAMPPRSPLNIHYANDRAFVATEQIESGFSFYAGLIPTSPDTGQIHAGL